MIVVEGLDNTGKTTLVDYLRDTFPMLHYTPSIGNKHVTTEIYKQAWKEAYHPDPLTISDRSRLISEYVYNPVLRARPTAYTVSQWLEMLGQFVVNGPHLIIYCNRRLANVREKWDNESQRSGIIENLTYLDYRYRTIMAFLELAFDAERHGSTIRRYDFEQDDISLYTQAVADYIKGAHQ